LTAAQLVALECQFLAHRQMVSPPAQKVMKSRIMYIERKVGLSGEARIGRVTFSKSGRSIRYAGRLFIRTSGFKSNYLDSKTREPYWISGCKKDGGDRLYPGTIEIDDDVREEYWIKIRKRPDLQDQASIRCVGKYGIS
jgi:hypothetical protein